MATGKREREVVGELQAQGHLHGLGFGLVHYFLGLILLCVGSGAAVAGFLAYYLGMDLSVEGVGLIEPRQRHLVKSQSKGIIRQIPVRQGQQVGKGSLLVVLDSRELETQLRKIDKDLQVNRSRRKEIEMQMGRQRTLLEGELECTQLEVEGAALHLEKVRSEQRLYSEAQLLPQGRGRRVLEDLVPVREARMAWRQKRALLRLKKQQLMAVKGGEQEIQTLLRIFEKLHQERELLKHRMERLSIRAPLGGTVLTGDLQRRVGDRIQAGEGIVEIAELDGWQARVMVGERDIPRVKKRQQVRLYIHAFPHLEYKIFSGLVEEIAVQPEAAGAGYPVRVLIDDPQIDEGGQAFSLAHGMSADAHIVVERGRIAALLWRRLLRSLGEFGQQGLFLSGAATDL